MELGGARVIWVRSAAILVILYIAVRAFLGFRGGVLRIRDTDEPILAISRRDRPVAFWGFVAFFYTVLVGMVALAASFP
jgi:hypothetical protein